ncbi:hypothetical protein HRE53_22770 [Acaryochloris sp. 'Moss Beach']|uniref:hypothetical protein n=1 Tax=Acaryochloris sp. 'Moss Beach' TaxID=2740837 RepID=UPI001F1FC13A|nr:hypothetical protein [Acaryochloris sp. 'Moss Beach']UJB69178.1 hypothetical protein HRE53_22770 [Acaryochloris sp. 'Moss Beach']
MISPDYPFVETRTLRRHFETGKYVDRELREKLPSPLYWVRPGSRKILWNLVLVRDYILHGGDRPEHQRLIEEYLASIEPPQIHPPKAARAAKGG